MKSVPRLTENLMNEMKDLDKLNFAELGYGGLVLSLRLLFVTVPPDSKL
jgi:hypothetical protein